MILLITQNQNLGKNITLDLFHEGFKVDVETDYNNAYLKLHQNYDYKIILIDLHSSDQTALQVCQKIKEDPITKYTPLISLVNRDNLVEHLLAFELGVDDFMFVPYTPPELQLKMRSIQRLLDLERELKEKEQKIENLKFINKLIATLNHYINNSLTPLYTIVQIINESNPEDVKKLVQYSKQTVIFIQKVLRALQQIVQSGEIKIVQEGIYKDLLIDIEKELKVLIQSSETSSINDSAS